MKKWLLMVMAVLFAGIFVAGSALAEGRDTESMVKDLAYGPLSMKVPGDYIVINDEIAYAVNPDYPERLNDVLFYHDSGFVSDTGEELFMVYKDRFRTVEDYAFTEEEAYQCGFIRGTMEKDALYTMNTLKRGTQKEDGEYRMTCYFYFYMAEVYMAVFRSDGDTSRLESYEKTLVFLP